MCIGIMCFMLGSVMFCCFFFFFFFFGGGGGGGWVNMQLINCFCKIRVVL